MTHSQDDCRADLSACFLGLVMAVFLTFFDYPLFASVGVGIAFAGVLCWSYRGSR